MNKSLLRNGWLPALLAGFFILADLVADRLTGGTRGFDLSHLVLGAVVLLLSSFLLNRAVVTRRRAEATLIQARNDMENQVHARTTELEQANEALRSAQLQAETEKRHLEAVLQALPVGVVITDAQGGVLLTNGMDERIWGPRPSTRGVEDYARYQAWWADSGRPVEAHEWASAQVVRSGESVYGQVLEIQRFDGGRGIILNSAVPIRDGEGRVIGSAVAVQDITELQRVEQGLRESEETSRALINASPQSAVLLDSQGVTLAANKTAAQSLGVTVEQMVGSSLFDFFPPEVAERRRTYLDIILNSCQPLHFTDERDGRTWDNYVYPVLDADGRIIRLAAFGQDITERLQAEARLREIAERLVLTQDAAGAGSWNWDIASGRFEWSAKMFELFGLDPRTTHASYDAWRSTLHPEDRAIAEKRIATALETHSELESEYRIVLPDGGIRWIGALGKGAYDDRDQPTRMSGICLDVTDRKLGEANIRRLSSFPQLNPNPVVEVDASGTITFQNPAVTRALERSGLADDARAFLPDDLAAILRELGEGRDSEFEREVQIGSAIFAEAVHVIPAFEVVRIYAFDITNRKRAEEALRASEEKYRLLFQNMAEGFALYELLYDEQGNPADWQVLEVNGAYTQHTGVERDQIVGRRISELFAAAIPEYLPRFAAVVATQTPTEFETYAAAVGRHQRVSTFPAGGHRFASIIEDVTKRKQSEEALRQAQEDLALDVQKRSALEERQRLARELHDSVSQAFYGVSLGVNTALALFDTNRTKTLEALNYALSLTHAGLAEMRALIFELRPESLEREGLAVAITKQAEAVRVRHDVAVELSLCDEPDVPLAVKETVYRIAQEALQNAIKHARAGRLDVRLIRDPAGLRLEMCDNGVGFDPTAAYPGHLGLQSMRERALQAGGTLEVISVPGSGTQIRAQIPIPVT